MPQMAPISWLSLYFLFFFCFLMYNILNYFCFFYKNLFMPLKTSNNQKNFYWKW